MQHMQGEPDQARHTCSNAANDREVKLLRQTLRTSMSLQPQVLMTVAPPPLILRSTYL